MLQVVTLEIYRWNVLLQNLKLDTSWRRRAVDVYASDF